METALNWLDALSLGGFCIIGANAALVRNLGPLLAVALSAITCTGGGVVRDVFLRQPVRVLHSHAELYGTTAIAGAGGRASTVAPPGGSAPGAVTRSGSEKGVASRSATANAALNA